MLFFSILKVFEMKILSEKYDASRVALALGANQGEPEAAFRRAAELLEAGGFTVEKQSAVYRTAAVDCAPGTPDFSNAALVGRWPGSPAALLQLTQAIEIQLGRPAVHAYHASRTMDLDIILFGNLRLASAELTLPHPRARQRAFVLLPLAEIAPEMRFPDSGCSVADALAALG